MKKALLFFSLISICSLLTAQTTTLKILTFNLRFGERASIDEIAQYINTVNPDIVALQEVDYKTYRKKAPHQNGIDMIGELSAKTKMFSTYGKTINYANGYYGIGILSKFPFAKTERILLPNPKPVSEQRALLVGEVILDNGKNFIFSVIHLDLTEVKQNLQLKTMNKILYNESVPVFVAGDFNLTPDNNILTKNMKQWQDALPNDKTFPSEGPTHKIDYIYYRKKDNIKVIESGVLSDCHLSDHFPAYAIIEITL